MKVFTIVIVFLFLSAGHASGQLSNPAQPDTANGVRIDKLSIGALVDVYYGAVPTLAGGNQVPYFVSSGRNNEWSVNLAYVDVRYTDNRVRARIIPAFGSFMESNFSGESSGFRNLLEANAGIRLTKKRAIWLDMGILSSPYTNESAVSKDHLMYTRSLAPEYVPYYLAGAKLTFPLHRKATFYLMLLNGWQEINDRNSSKSLGTQLEYRWNDSNLLNWNTYIGEEGSPARRDFGLRYFTDVYWVHQSEGPWSWTSCAYLGIQEITTQSGQKNSEWWQWNAIVKRRISDDWSLAVRGEYFSDPNAIQIIPVNFTERSFDAWSAGLCASYHSGAHALLRFEGRYFGSSRSVFPSSAASFNTRMLWLSSSLCVWF
jgi:hypothetical protein